MPTAKDVDMRRRNSLMFFMRDWQELTTFEQQEASMVQVGRNNLVLGGRYRRWRGIKRAFFILITSNSIESKGCRRARR